MNAEQQQDVLREIHECGVAFEEAMKINVSHLMAMSGDDVFRLRASKGLIDSMRFVFINASESFQELIDELEGRAHSE